MPGEEEETTDYKRTVTNDDDESFHPSSLSKKQSAFSLKTTEPNDEHILWFARWLANHPIKLSCFCLFITILLAFIASLKYKLAEDGDRAWLAESSALDDLDAATLAIEALNTGDTTSLARTQRNEHTGIIANFKTSNDQIMTLDFIKRMYDIEQEIANMTVYKERLCYVDTDPTQCSYEAVESLLSHFIGYTTQSQINTALANLSDDYWWHLSEDFPNTLKSNIYKSNIYSGYPYPNASYSMYSNYKNDEDDFEGQSEPYLEWNEDIWDKYEISADGLELKPFSWALMEMWLTEQFDMMTTLLSFAILLILVYLCIHTQSLFLGGIGMLQILFSFCPAYVIYRFVIRVTYFGVMNMMIVFIILGIGADDMFVMTDAWVQSKHQHENDPLHRINYTFRRAAKAMMITSLTTAVAFFSTAISKVVAIRAFGIWAGWVILCNYVYFITLFPCLIMIQYYYPLVRCCGIDQCCHKCGADKVCTCCKPHHAAEELEIKESGDDSADDGDGDLRCLERCFKNQFHPFIMKMRYPIMVCFIALLAAGLWSTTELQPPQTAEDWIKPSSDLGKLLTMGQDYYSNPEFELVKTTYYWGIDGVDKAGTDPWDPEDYGVVIWDENFNLLTVENQQYILDTCETLAANEEITSEPVACFMKDFKVFLESRNETWPKSYATQAELDADMLIFIQPGNGGEDYLYDNLLGYEYHVDDDSYTFRFCAIKVTTNLNYDRDKPEDKRDMKDKCDDFLNDINKNAPAGMNNCIQANEFWPWLNTEKALLQGAISGIGIAIPLATLMLIVFTDNWIVTCFAVLTIIGVIVSLSLFVIVLGWEFGVVESINVILVVGFSIDYVVHLAHAYLEAGEIYDDRDERLKFSLLSMGISVSSGAFTTAISGIPLLFSLMTFLYKMGALIIATVIFSILWALLLFTSCMATFGPEKEQGAIFHHCCDRKKTMDDAAGGEVTTTNIELGEGQIVL